MPTTAELLAALPPEKASENAPSASLDAMFRSLSVRPVPHGVFRRLGTLTGLSTKLGLAYLAYWIRSWYLPNDQREKDLLDTHMRSALNTLETMGYLRGAVAKMGQLLTSFPETLPAEFVSTLSNLHFQAPPMHFSLIREQLLSELGDPHDVFDAFDERAIAAASIGQVHRARLKDGQEVAVKIQYPGIARTIRADLRSLKAMMRPFHYNENWKSVSAIFEELRVGLEAETDYLQEAENIREVYRLFEHDESIVVPQAIERYSAERVITMTFLDGQTIESFLATQPSQERRDHFGTAISRALWQIYGERMLYNDAHPGNFLFYPDGRLGLLDFGNLRRFDEEEWKFHRRVYDLRFQEKNEQQRRELCADSALMTENERRQRPEVVDLIMEWLEFFDEPLLCEGAYDYGDPANMKRGAELLAKAAKVNWVRQKPENLFSHRLNFQLAALLFQLKSRVDVGALVREPPDLEN